MLQIRVKHPSIYWQRAHEEKKLKTLKGSETKSESNLETAAAVDSSKGLSTD